jgi:hypothetical protein
MINVAILDRRICPVDGRFVLPKNTLLDGSYRIERVIGSGGFGHLLVKIHGADVFIGMSPAFEDSILVPERQTSHPIAIYNRLFTVMAQ